MFLFRQAKNLCDIDLRCGGFTFKGSRSLLDKEYNIFFFHILVNIKKDLNSLKWTVYKAIKEFLSFPGVFSRKVSPMKLPGLGKKKKIGPEARCRKLSSNCVGIEINNNSSDITFLQYLGSFHKPEKPIEHLHSLNDIERNTFQKTEKTKLNSCQT